MATLEALGSSLEVYIKERREVQRWSYCEISKDLRNRYPGERGFSTRSLQRYCSENGISKTSKIGDDELDQVVSEAVSMVGPTYGRKTMTGLLSSCSIRVSQQRVRQSLMNVSPLYHSSRAAGAERQLNPIPYHADYFGHKIHCDQNEKLGPYGVTHTCAVDGYSGMILGVATMPIKNCIEIYRSLFRPIIEEYGLWDQVRVDHGKEWTLLLFAQEQLAGYRRNLSRPPHLQTSSKQNHRVERVWVEVNCRVNYPIKHTLVILEERGDISMDDPCHQYCVSWYTMNVSSVGIAIVMQSWNDHPISSSCRGVPSQGSPRQIMMRSDQTMKIDNTIIKDASDIAREFEDLGGHLTEFTPFGEDPLRDRSDLISRRDYYFFKKFLNLSPYFMLLLMVICQSLEMGYST